MNIIKGSLRCLYDDDYSSESSNVLEVVIEGSASFQFASQGKIGRLILTNRSFSFTDIEPRARCWREMSNCVIFL